MPSEILDRMYRNPGSVHRRALVAALESHGWRLVRRSRGHDVYAKSGWAEVVAVPARLKGTGTIRRIVRQIQIEEASRE
ncbi:MAG: type II toxin-antitoxin system HicA family toxin [Chloroflexi bacterium]|nr:type II toxin-antitoxin system HicA family toxin [Chloroflexota bacterium]